MKIYLTLLYSLILVTSCNFEKGDCSVVKMDNSTKEINHVFVPKDKTKDGYFFDSKIKYYFNDTMLFGEVKTPPMDTIIELKHMGYYYNKDGPQISYKIKNYKATEVDIEISYCFY